jgi:hypothetical protein
MNVATRHDVSMVNFWNNKNTFFSHTNTLSDLDIRILESGADFSIFQISHTPFFFIGTMQKQSTLNWEKFFHFQTKFLKK